MSMNNKKPKAKTALASGGPGKTKQASAAEADINNIIARYQKTGMAPVTDAQRGSFRDVSRIGSYADVLRQVTAANEGFRRLPSKIRSRFGNDPARLIEFLQDDRNGEEAVRLGLATKVEEEVPVPAKPGPASWGSAPAGVKGESDKK